MDSKTQLTTDDILKKRFTKDVKGYSADEVDAFLDRIIQDYVNFVSALSLDEATIATLKKEAEANQATSVARANQAQGQYASAMENLRKQLADVQGNLDEAEKALAAQTAKTHKVELENASLHNRLDGIKPGDSVTVENMRYIQRINTLEDFIFSIGYDPNTLKKRSS